MASSLVEESLRLSSVCLSVNSVSLKVTVFNDSIVGVVFCVCGDELSFVKSYSFSNILSVNVHSVLGD